MEGIAQEVGVDMNELKVVLVGDGTQLDVKPLQLLKEQYHQVELGLQEARPASQPGTLCRAMPEAGCTAPPVLQQARLS